MLLGGTVTGAKSYKELRSTSVYSDSLSSGWQDYSWATIVIGATGGTNGAKVGSKFIKVTVCVSIF